MKVKDSDIDKVISAYLEQLVPEAMTPKERKALAKTAGISEDTLRTVRRRNSLSANTLFRLLAAHGIAPEDILKLIKGNPRIMSKPWQDWIKLGSQVPDDQKSDFADIVRFIKAKWD